MRYIVYGAGAVGGVVGARLALAGYDVALVARGAHLQAIRESGLILESPGSRDSVRLPASAESADLVTGDDCVLLAVKGQDTAGAVRDLSGTLSGDATVVSLQNGVANEREVLRSFAHVLGICVMLPSTHLEPGVVVANSSPVPGILDIGRFPHGSDERAETVAGALRTAGFESVVRPDIMAWKHRKLIRNLGNAIQAACAPGPDADRLAHIVRQEGEDVLTHAGIPVVSNDEDDARRGTILSPGSIGGRGGGSTWQSLARGQGSVESDYLNGEISLLGRLYDVPTPANDLVRETAWVLARGGERPGSRAAADLLTRLGRPA